MTRKKIARPARVAIAVSIWASWIAFAPHGAPALAETPASVRNAARRRAQPANIIHVDPVGGDDERGSGTEVSPLRTIARALSAAEPNTIVRLRPGLYSHHSGERFPLQLRPGVTVLGDSDRWGDGVILWGGGEALTSEGRKNVTVLGADRAGLSGVKITNTNPGGYGLWIESGTPFIVRNTFENSDRDGIVVTGNATPQIRENRFFENRGSGLSIFSDSAPTVADNIFENTGFGISVGDRAAPDLAGNEIFANQDGVVVQAEARPVLRDNTIEYNRRYGAIAVGRARPDLGRADDPGNNVLRGNGSHDIYNYVPETTLYARGNAIDNKRVAGLVDVDADSGAKLASEPPTVPDRLATDATDSFARQPSLPRTPARRVADRGSDSAEIVTISVALPENNTETDLENRSDRASPFGTSPDGDREIEASVETIPIPLPATESELPVGVLPFLAAAGSEVAPDRDIENIENSDRAPQPEILPDFGNEAEASDFSATSPPEPETEALSESDLAAATGDLIQIPEPETERDIEITEPPSGRRSPLPSLEEPALAFERGAIDLEAGVLQVPNSDVPIGRAGDRGLRIVSENGLEVPPPPGIPIPSEPVVEIEPYRVAIEVRDNAERDRVARLFEAAFPLTIGGRTYMQVDIFEDRDRALEFADALRDRGFVVFVIQLEEPESSAVPLDSIRETVSGRAK